ncbi:MAG: glycosyltransferase family 4 protein [Lachnospiraceae bacterium]|nr:glycosyltransferase family 4 protein [Lachnospiraceae bacterium]
MKIVFFSGDIGRSGGTERVLCTIANGLVAKGYDIVIFSLTGQGPVFFPLDKRIKVCWIGSRGLQTDILQNLNKLRKFMKAEKPDFLVDVDIILGFYSILLKMMFRDVHWISWEHFNFYTKFPVNHNLRKVARFLVSRFSECLVVLSEEDKGYYESNMKLRCRIEKIHNPTPYDVTKIENEKTIEEKKVLAVGALVWIKGYDMLLKSWRPVEKKHPDWKLQFIGDGEEKENLIREAEKLGIKNVEFVGKVADVVEYYKKAAFLVLSSRNEGFPMVLLEAMSYSLPVVAFQCKAGVTVTVKDNETGYLVKNRDLRDLARKLDSMIEDDEKRRIMGENAKKHMENFSLEKITEEWDRLFHDLKK